VHIGRAFHFLVLQHTTQAAKDLDLEIYWKSMHLKQFRVLLSSFVTMTWWLC
jgi:hypothetical protein